MKVWLKNAFRQAAWAPLAVFVFYAVAAKGFGAYIHYPWLDIPTHFCGGMAITYFFLAAIVHSQARIGNIPKIIQSALSLGLTALIAVIWEFLEYFSDVAWGTTMNLGVADTLSDLFYGLAGGLVVLFAIARTTRVAPATSDGNANA